MPLLKGAKTPAASTAVAEKPTETAQAPAAEQKGPVNLNAKLMSLDAKDRKILLQGSFQAALHSVGAVQHGGKSFADYLARVKEAAMANVNFVLEHM